MTRVHDEPELVEPTEQSVGQALRRERGFVDTFRGRIELDRLDQLGWERGGDGLVRGLAARKPVSVDTREPEPAEHRRLGQLRECAERAQPEPREKIGELGATVDVRREYSHRPRREEYGRLTAWHDERIGRARGEPGSEITVSDPDARVHHTCLAHHLEYPARERIVTTEVARGTARGERTTSGPVEHELWYELFDHAHHHLERARVRRVVGVDDRELRAPRLGLTPSEPSRHSFTTCFNRRRLHDRTTITR